MWIFDAGLKRMVMFYMGASVFCGSLSPAFAITDPRSWNNYTWGREGNLNIQLVNNTSAQWSPYVVTAANQWSTANNIDFKVISGPEVDASVCNPSYGVVEVCSANYGKTGWLGLTNVYTSGGHIVMATVKYNDYYPMTSSFYSTESWFTNTSCHELGHVLGLTHEDDTKNNANTGSCLDLTNDPSGEKSGYGPISDLTPGLDDFAALARIYAVPSGIQLPGTFDDTEVPEPAVWAMMMTGFGVLGSFMRRRAWSRVRRPYRPARFVKFDLR